MTIDQAMAMAVDHHRRGRLGEAERIYREILVRAPAHADALHMLGLMAGGTGKLDVAVKLIGRAITAKPDVAVYYINLGKTLGRMGRAEEAMGAFERAIELKPKDATICNELGDALRARGRIVGAVAAYRRAVEIKPDFSLGFSNLGATLQMIGRAEEAAAACRRAIEIEPGFPQDYSNLGAALAEMGLLEEAVAAYEEALRLKPDFVEARCNLGNALSNLGKLHEAIGVFRRAIEIRGDYGDAYNGLGTTLRKRGEYGEAIAAYERALQLKPKFAEAQNNIGTALKDQREIEGAIEAYRKAIGMKGDFADAHFNLGHMLLLRGDFAEGWVEYEWRWRMKAFLKGRRYEQPQWRGKAIDGRTILLHAEQGLGDTLQFIRYAPLVAERGARVIVECQRQLVRLLEGMEGVQSVHGIGEELPAFDVHCPMMSLPMAFHTSLETIPAEMPYLGIEGSSGEEKRNREVGLVWAGSPTHTNDRNRSIPLRMLGALSEVSVCFHSLQAGVAGGQMGEVAELKLIDHSEEIVDFADTARLIRGLDLIITVDTAVAHLAGAMGKAVWVMLPYVADWRWMLDREDSPWYPTMRLFRQKVAGEWDEVVGRVVGALKERYS